MVENECKLIVKNIDGMTRENFVDGYFLTIHDLSKLVRDFQVDCHDGFVSNDYSYIEEWLKKHNRIETVNK